MSNNKNGFNLFDEWARGIMYRGGQERDDFLSGYVWGIVFYGIVVFVLYIVGVVMGG